MTERKLVVTLVVDGQEIMTKDVPMDARSFVDWPALRSVVRHATDLAQAIKPQVRFCDLTPGDTFEFDHSDLSSCSDTAHGPWRKVGARLYSRALHPEQPPYKVGATQVRVRRGHVPCR